MTRKVTAPEVKAKLLALLDAVDAGEEIEITRHGVTVARLSPERGPHALIGRFRGVAMSAAPEELAWLALHERIRITRPLLAWLNGLAGQVRTVGTTPAIAATAVSLPSTFPSDPADRLIYATAIEYGWRLVTKDERLSSHRNPREITVW